MNKWDKFWNWFIGSRTDGAMVARTVVEATASWLVANSGDILNLFHISEPVKGLIMGLLTVIFTKVIASIRQQKELKQISAN